VRKRGYDAETLVLVGLALLNVTLWLVFEIPVRAEMDACRSAQPSNQYRKDDIVDACEVFATLGNQSSKMAEMAANTMIL
jgi:hypothetical protein